MSWVSWIVGGVAAAGGMAAKELITNAGKKHLEEPYEAKKKAKNEQIKEPEINVEDFIPEAEQPAPKKSRKKKEET